MTNSEKLNPEQTRILNDIINFPTKNFFITGPAGVGKSFLLKKLVNELTKKHKPDEIGVAAMTGLAATSINGSTLHSWTGLGLHGTKKPSSFVKNRWKKCKTLIVDEISMCSRSYFEQIFPYLSKVRVIFFGDFFQLPPVNGEMIFESDKWNEMLFNIYEMKTVVRQNDLEFINCLHEIRKGKLSQTTIDYLQRFCITNKKDEIIKTEIVEEGIKKIEITPNNVVKKKNLILFF